LPLVVGVALSILLVGALVLTGCCVPLEILKRTTVMPTISAVVNRASFPAGVYATEPTKVHSWVVAGGFRWDLGRASTRVLDVSALRPFAEIRDGNLS
jgi:hypothetical protein